MDDDNLLPFSLPAGAGKKLTAALDGGRLTSDGGVLLLAAVERRVQIAERLAGEIAGPRAAARVVHTGGEIPRGPRRAVAGRRRAADADRGTPCRGDRRSARRRAGGAYGGGHPACTDAGDRLRLGGRRRSRPAADRPRHPART